MKRNTYRPNYSKLYPDTHISKEVLNVLKKGDRKAEYQEYDIKREVWSIDLQTQTAKCIPSREDSIERQMEGGRQFTHQNECVEDIAVKNIMLEKLRSCLDLLDNDERWIIDALFYRSKTEKEIAKILSVHQSTVSRTRSRILFKLRGYLEK